MTYRYVLSGREAVQEPDLIKWANWMAGFEKRRVAQTSVGDARVSTVFLGIDHGSGIGPPILFETMVFNGELDQEQVRYSTYDEAEAGHTEMVERVKQRGLEPQGDKE